MTDREHLDALPEECIHPSHETAEAHPPMGLGKSQLFVPKETNFKLKKAYEALLEMHEDFGPFDSDVVMREWKAWFREDISGERKKLLEVCLFAYCLIPAIDGTWFDDTKYDDTVYDYNGDKKIRYGQEEISHLGILKYRTTLKKTPTLVSNCLHDLISDKFQSIYLGNRQEQGENWIRVAHIIWKRDKKGVIKTSKLSMKTLIDFILMDTKEKQQEIKSLTFHGDMNFRPIGHSLGCSMLEHTTQELQRAGGAFVWGIKSATYKSQPGHLKTPTNPFFSDRPTLHVTLYTRCKGLTRQAYGSRYIAGAGAAFVKTFFNKEMMSATSKVYGLQAKLEDYNRLVRSPNLDKVLQEFRNEMPVLARLLKTLRKTDREKPFETFNKVRDRYFDKGLTPAGWRFLKRISPTDVYKLIDDRVAFDICHKLNEPTRDNNPIPALAFLSEIGIFCHQKPRARLLAPLLKLYQVNNEAADQWHRRPPEPHDPDKHFFRAFAMHVLTSTDSVQNLRDLCSDAVDAIGRTPPERINALIGPRKITTARAMHILQIAHDEMHQGVNEDRGNQTLSWPACLKEFEHKEFIFRELNNSEELYKEGDEMHHCIGGYGRLCLDGDMRIFSGTTSAIESRKNRISVAVKKSETGSWSTQQVRGFANRGASKEEKAATRALCRALARAELQSNKEISSS
ncbi:hypothetical protein CL689_02540 [Candidatus Saccharibacteria bacterium]|nr:hypothetical protein [Candidatus Saccharibacteria bacterium]|tara:strand:- start:3645 stop:5690 length:2046 start_codon:yes stop_codon:yes gene_type:complete